MKKYIKYLKRGTIAGVVMAMIEMIYEGLWGIGFWAPPALISGVVFTDLVDLVAPIGFLFVPFIVGLIIHKMMGGVLAVILERIYIALGINSCLNRIIFGAVYGLAIFVVMWFVVLPIINPAMLILNAPMFAAAHAVFGIILGRLTTANGS